MHKPGDDEPNQHQQAHYRQFDIAGLAHAALMGKT